MRVRNLVLSLAIMTGVVLCGAGAASADESREENNIAAAKAFFGAFASGDMATVFGMFSYDVQWHIYGSEDKIPIHGNHIGLDGMKEFFTGMQNTWATSAFDVEEYFADGDTVICIGRMAGTAVPTGKPFDEHWACFLTFSGGKITKVRIFDDSGQEIWALTK